MDFTDSPGEAAFRAEARAWLGKHGPAFYLPVGPIEDTEEMQRGRAWLKRKFDHGYAGIMLPRELGGRGGTMTEAILFDEEEARHRLPCGAYITIGLNMAVATIRKHGTLEQNERFVEPTLRGEMTWCQLLSEPSAGSDLGGLRTRATRDEPTGDWIVNGQKVWSSWARLADWGLLVARSDPSVAKHKGLTFFVVDMKTPGIDVRPIRQMSGLNDFNEVFLTDVRIPDANRIGAVNEGWGSLMTLLGSERLASGSESSPRGTADLIAYAAATPKGRGNALDSGATRLALASAYAEERAETHLHMRLRTMIARGENPGATAAMLKLAYASRSQRMSGFALELRGMGGLAPPPDDRVTRNIWYDYIWTVAMRIAGGADEVLRNQIAERLLGMPGEMRADKDVPFDQIKA
jgi:alkylation response protein AidB-like acyl-CoA dehydrogenase